MFVVITRYRYLFNLIIMIGSNSLFMLVQYIMSSSRVGGRLNKYPKGPAPTLRGGHVTWSLLHQTMDPTFAFKVTLTQGH